MPRRQLSSKNHILANLVRRVVESQSGRWNSDETTGCGGGDIARDDVDVDVPLTEIEASGQGNGSYMLRGIGTEGNAWSASFGVSDLAGLQPGDVLAEISRDDAEKNYIHNADGSGVYVAVTQEEFEARAAKFCEEP